MSTRFRIAYIAPYPAGGLVPDEAIKTKYLHKEHPATWVRLLAGELGRMDAVELRVFVDCRTIRARHIIESTGVTYDYVPKREPIRSDPYHLFVPSYFRLRNQIRDFRPDVIVGFGVESGCATVAGYFKTPSVQFIQGIHEVNNPFRSISFVRKRACEFVERLTLRNIDGVIAETEFARGWALRADRTANVTVIPHPVETRFFHVAPDRASKRILCIGTLHGVKGPDTVLRAFARVQQRDAELVMVGGGPMKPQLVQLASSLGIADRVTFSGQLPPDRVPAEMAASRLLVIGSRMDTSPNVVTEAHAASLPVVGTTAGGIPDMVTHGVDGFLVGVDDADGMGQYIDDLLADSALCESFGKAGREKVTTLNDAKRVAEMHVAFYRSVAAQHVQVAKPRSHRRFSTEQTPTVRHERSSP